MHAHAEPIAWRVRIYESDAGGFERKEKWVSSCVAQASIEHPDTVEITLLSDRFGYRMKRAVMKLAKEHGFSTIAYQRCGEVHRMTVR